jgi:hypothetical protein
MKKILLVCSLVLVGATLSFGQAKKPTLMVVPSDVWCNTNGYMMEFDDQGTKVKIPDYKRALQENPDLLLVISSINDMMAEREFPLKNLESALKTLSSNSAEDNMLASKEDGAGVSETPIDALKKVAKADIIIQMTWTVNTTGPKKSITFILQGLDAYTDKQIAGANGTGAPSMSAEAPVLLKEAVTAHIDNFAASLQSHFADMFENGREVIIRVKKWDSWDGDLETEFDGEELGTIIEDWMAANTQKGRFSTTDMTENMALFEQVRIPLFNEKGRASDARDFAKGLSKMLKEAPYNIPNKLMMKGLGRATIILGGK